MGLEFAPLGWIYHDSWKWEEEYLIHGNGMYGQPSVTKKNKNFCQMGHCHFFFPDYDPFMSSNSLAYWGTQNYNFEIVDEWGPNSNDKVQDKSVKLLGKPIWYFYIQEYWRRIYVQPWDKIDLDCDLPLNQSVNYDIYTLTEYMNKVIEQNNLMESNYEVDVEWQSLDYYSMGEYKIGFKDYFIIKRRTVARYLWAIENMSDFKENISDNEIINYIKQEREFTNDNVPANNYWSLYNGSLSSANIILHDNWDAYTFYEIGHVVPITYIDNSNYYPVEIKKYWICIKNNTGFSPPSSLKYNYIENFEQFYANNYEKNQGYVQRIDAMKEFLMKNNINVNEYKQDDKGNIYIPQKNKTGHVGIKYDASLPCHSLGPFREGGEFFFFNTVVNRTMPMEYWLDEDKNTRQYYLKQNDNPDTTGGGTWTFESDNKHFIWVYDNFNELQNHINGWGNEWESDSWTYNNYNYDCHRRRQIVFNNNVNYYFYIYCRQNAKRLKNDQFKYIGEFKSNDTHYGDYKLQYDEKTWYGRNDKVLHNDYDEQAYQEQVENRENDKTLNGNSYVDKDGVTHEIGYYDDTGWHSYDEKKDDEKTTFKESPNAIHWEKRQSGWKGWYEIDELIKWYHDGNYYKRAWKPYLYNLNDPYQEQTENVYDKDKIIKPTNAPHWNWIKRQSFPNPPPWLCNPDYQISKDDYYVNKINDYETQHFATKHDVYENDNDNRIHLLHWEYCHYYNLIRKYTASYDGMHFTKQYYYIFYVPADQSYNKIAHKEYFSEDVSNFDYSEYQNYKNYQKEKIACDWETALDDYIQEYGELKNIQEENQLFNNFISKLPDDLNNIKNGNYYLSPFYYQDYFEYKYTTKNSYGYVTENVITKEMMNTNGTYNKEIYQDGQWITITEDLPAPVYKVNYNANPVNGEYLTYISFNDFSSIWIKLTDEEVKKLNLIGDYPQRNNIPYPIPESFEEMYGSPDEMSAEEYKIKKYFWDNKINYNIDEANDDEKTVKLKEKLKQEYSKQAAPYLINSDFFPRYDEFDYTSKETLAMVGVSLPKGATIEKSILNEVKDINIFDTIDVFRANSENPINPIDNWKKYFTKREVYTIPKSTYVKGSKTVNNSESQLAILHPRETSYSIQDGARRFYPNDKFITPIIEYQKVVHLNYERLPDKQEESRLYELENEIIFLEKKDENGNLILDDFGNSIPISTPPPVWKTDKFCQWGDGFNVNISIPFKINGEVQSPFSDNTKITKPAGVYCHNVVKPQDMMRYHIDFYDSLEKIRLFDFPNYVNIIRDFQELYIPENAETQDYTASLYQENFYDYEDTLKRRQEYVPDNCPHVSPNEYPTWAELLEKYWIQIKDDVDKPIACNPIIRNHNCYGEQIVENTFEKLNNGQMIWREEVTSILPTKEQVAQTVDSEGNIVKGYINSKNELVKGGAVVTFNDPYSKGDGKWVEQCLGAVVKARCVQILEDNMGYRWKAITESTALQQEETLKGSDYDSTQ